MSEQVLQQLQSALADRYTIERELGEGGMATVYLARDIKHDRNVALKVLKPELGAVLGAERFLAEIKVTANLQHPNLLPLFDSGAADGLLFYVMPFVAGETLRARLDREKQLPIDDGVRIATAIASGLDYAHRHGVVHRDLKPENVLLHEGQPLIADFGIALALNRAGGARMTQTGLSLGTPHYMSPEQASGESTVDARTDIYALGALAYEMLAGEPPHTGPTAQAIIARLMTEEPRALASVRPAVSGGVDQAVRRALAKTPADRWATAREFADALAGTGVAMTARHRVTRALRSPLLWGSALALVAAAALGAFVMSRGGESGQVARYPLAFAPEEAIQLGSADGATMGMSPDGKALVYVGSGAATRKQVFVRAVSDLRARAIAGTDGATQAFFSPDGKWIGFVANQKLQKVPVGGGTATVIADIGSSVRGVSWGSDDRIVIAATRLFVVPSSGGQLRPIVRIDSATVGGSQAWPCALPDGTTVLYTIWHGSLASARIGVTTIEGGQSTELELPGTAPLGVIEGRLIYVGPTGTLMAVPFDAKRARVTGAPAALSDQVLVAPNGGVNASLSPSGALVYQAGPSAQQVVLAAATAEPRVLISDPRLYSTPRFSPDGKRVAVTAASGASQDIWIYDIAARALTKLTTEGNNDRPEWTPDGKHVLYRSSRAGMFFSIWWQAMDGGTPAESLVRANAADVAEAVLSADGRTVIYRTGSAGTANLWYRRLGGDTTPKPIAMTKATETAARISPDGQWVAYVSDESGQLQVYVVPFPGLGARYQVTLDGGSSPVWSPDGRQLLYVHAGKIMAAVLASGAEFKVVSRELRQDGEWSIAGGGHAGFDVSPDGKDLLLVRSVGGNVQTIVALNWRAEVRARAAPKK